LDEVALLANLKDVLIGLNSLAIHFDVAIPSSKVVLDDQVVIFIAGTGLVLG
jgi:hypothetical protein